MRSFCFLLFVWLGVFCLLQLSIKNKNVEYISRIVSLLHSVLATASCGYAHLQKPLSPFGEPSSWYHDFTLRLSASYFVYDTIVGINYSILESHFIFHHAVASAALLYGIYQKISGWEINACLFFMEVSNPFYHLDWVLQHSKHPNVIDFYNQLAFVVTFFVFRLGFGSVLLFAALYSQKVNIFVKSCAIGLLILNIGFTCVLLGEFQAFFSGGLMVLP